MSALVYTGPSGKLLRKDGVINWRKYRWLFFGWVNRFMARFIQRGRASYRRFSKRVASRSDKPACSSNAFSLLTSLTCSIFLSPSDLVLCGFFFCFQLIVWVNVALKFV